jgi:hypothetical protein
MVPDGHAVAILGALAAVAAVLAAGLVLGLHMLPTGVEARREGVSAYALGRWASLYAAQALASGVAALSVAAGAVVVGPAPMIGVVALAVYGGARIAIIRYPTDPPGTAPLSGTGRVHAVLASAAFVALGVAAPLVGLGMDWSTAAALRAALVALSVAVPVTVLATFAAGAVPRLRDSFGAVERGIYAAGLPWLFVAGLALIASAA